MYKKLLICLFTSLYLLQLHAQKAIPLAQAEEKGYDLTKLEKEYGADPAGNSKSLFEQVDKDQIINAWTKLNKDLSVYAKKNGFDWKSQSRGFNKVYFNKDGSIHLFFYRIDKDYFTYKEQEQFHKLINQFVKDYRFDIQLKKPFTFCGGVVYNGGE